MPTAEEINARIDAAIKESTEKYEALRVELLKEVKPAYEVRKVYKDPKSNMLAKVLENNNGVLAVYGFDHEGKWFVNKTYYPLSDKVEAPQDEWFEALKKEAAKRGLVKGASADLSSVLSLFRKDAVFKSNEYSFGMEGFCLDKMYIMIGGLWATPIAPVKEKTTEDYLKDIYETSTIDFGQLGKLRSHFKDNNLKITPNA